MKKIPIFLIALIMISVNFFSGCTQEDELKGLGYVNREFGFGMNQPEGWRIDTNDSDALVVFIEPINEEFLVNIAVLGGNLDPGETPDMVANAMLEKYPSIYSDFTLISKDNMTINSMVAYEIVYTQVKDNIIIKQKQVYIEKHDAVLILLLTAPNVEYNTFIPVFEECVNSVKIIW